MPESYAGVVCRNCKAFIRIDQLTGDQKRSYSPRPSYQQDLECSRCGHTARYVADDIKVIEDINN